MLKKRLLTVGIIAIMVFSMIIILSFHAVKADTLFIDGFESGRFDEWDTVGSPSIVDNPVKDGMFSANFPLATPACYGIKWITPTNTLDFTYYVYFDAFCTDYICVVLAEDANNTLIHYRVQSIDGTTRWQFNVGTSLVINASTPTPQLGQWYKIQLLAMTGENGTFYFLVNDQLRATITNQTFGLINQVRIGHDWNEGYVGGSMYVDNVLVANITNPVIIASAGEGGTISPNGVINVNRGNDQTFTIIADPGYRIADVTVNGTSQGPVSTYTFTNVQGNYVIIATFVAEPTPTPSPPPTVTPTPPETSPSPTPTATPTPTPTAPATTSSVQSTYSPHTNATPKPSTPTQDSENDPSAIPTLTPSTSASNPPESTKTTFQFPWIAIIILATLIVIVSMGLTLKYKRHQIAN